MITEEIKLERKREMIEKVLNHRIIGDSYFISSTVNWKSIVLQKFNSVYRNEMSILDIIVLLKKTDVKFTQNENIIYFPIKELLIYIGKISNKPLNL